MPFRRTILPLVLALAAGTACKQDDANGPVGQPVNFSMSGFNGSGVTGTARIEDQEGSGATVTISLQNLPAGAHAGHVHQGSCDQQGAILFGLNPITPDGQGTGTVTTMDVPDNLLMPGFYIQYHVALDPPGAPIACADIPTAAAPGGGDMGGGNGGGGGGGY